MTKGRSKALARCAMPQLPEAARTACEAPRGFCRGDRRTHPRQPAGKAGSPGLASCSSSRAAAASCPTSPLLGREVGGCRARGEAALAGADARHAVAGAAAGFAQPGPCCRGAARHARRMAEASSAVAHYCWCQTEGEVPRRSRGLSAARNNASRRYFEKTCALSMSLFCKGRQVSRRGWSAMFIISLFFEELELDVPAPSPCSLQRGSTSIWIFPSKLRAHPAFSSFRFGWLSG